MPSISRWLQLLPGFTTENGSPSLGRRFIQETQTVVVNEKPRDFRCRPRHNWVNKWDWFFKYMVNICLIYGLIYALWLLHIAMENGPFIDGLPGFTY